MTPATPPAPPLLPWGLVGRMMAVFTVPMVVVAILVDPGAAAALVLGGVLPGFGAMAMGKRPVAFVAMGVLLVVTLLITVLPQEWLAWAIAFALAGAAGWEATKTGGRAFVLALIGFVALFLIPSMPATGTALPFMAGGLVIGILASTWLKLTGMLAPPSRSLKFGISLAVFLIVGLIISAGVTQWVEQRYAYWVVLLFVFRSLSPDQGAGERLGRYAVGSIIGGLAALLFVYLGLPALIALSLAVPLLALGLRHAAQPTLVSAATSTAGVLLIMPVGTDDILFRVQAVLAVVAIAAGLFVALSYGWRLAERMGGRDTTM